VARPSESTASCPRCGGHREFYSTRDKFVAYVPFTSNKRFTPHLNTAFGCYVDSPQQLAHLQRVHGCEDVSVKPAGHSLPSSFGTKDFDGAGGRGFSELETIDDDHLESAADTGLTADDVAAHAGVA